MSGHIINSKGTSVGKIIGSAIFDLQGQKLYALQGINIYKLFWRGNFARIKQSMEMDDEIAHVRIIDGLLSLGPPGCMCGCVV